MEARPMESYKITYKWRPELWNHDKFQTNGDQSYGIMKKCIQIEARAMESHKTALWARSVLANTLRNAAEGEH